MAEESNHETVAGDAGRPVNALGAESVGNEVNVEEGGHGAVTGAGNVGQGSVAGGPGSGPGGQLGGQLAGQGLGGPVPNGSEGPGAAQGVVPQSPTGDDDASTPGVNSAGSRERRKIEIKFIENKTRRHVTFSKRKHGIMKKAFELSVLTGTQVLLLVVSETGLVYTFSTPKFEPIVTQQEGRNLIQACLNAPDEEEEEEEEEKVLQQPKQEPYVPQPQQQVHPPPPQQPPQQQHPYQNGQPSPYLHPDQNAVYQQYFQDSQHQY